MIESVIFFFSGSAMVMLFILFLRIKAVGGKSKLAKHRAQDPGFVDLLIYASVVDDGVIVGKDGSLMAAWAYQGVDSNSSTQAERNQISLQINHALSRMGSGWMIHIDAVRKPAPGYSNKDVSHFPDAVSAAIDEERREFFERVGTLYESSYVITATYLPPLLAQQKFVELMFDDEGVPVDSKTRTIALLNHFKRECATIESHLSSVFRMKRLKGKTITQEDHTSVNYDAFLCWIQFCISGLDHPVILPKNPIYLDALLSGQEFWGGVVPKIGHHFIQVVSIEGFPIGILARSH
jgi:type IV secretory pathway VirB4 component